MLIRGGEHVYLVITYHEEVMTKNEHVIWAAHFSPSIFVRQCVSSLSFMASQLWQVYPCFCRVRVDHCPIRVLLPTFSQMCLCLLLTGACVTLGGAPFICQQINKMQCLTHPFTDSSGSVPSFGAHAPFFHDTLCRLSCF